MVREITRRLKPSARAVAACVVLIFSFSIASCGEKPVPKEKEKEKEKKAEPTSSRKRDRDKEKEILQSKKTGWGDPLKILECGDYGTAFSKDPKIMIADDENSYRSIHMLIHAGKSAKPERYDVNFEDNSVVLIYGGKQRRIGRSMAVTDWSESSGSLLLEVKTFRAPERTAPSGISANPYCLITVDKGKINSISVNGDVEFDKSKYSLSEDKMVEPESREEIEPEGLDEEERAEEKPGEDKKEYDESKSD